MLRNLLYEGFFTIQYIQRNEIKVKTLANIYATRCGFINEEFVESVCQILEIQSQYSIKLKQIERLDGKAAKPITHAIYLILTINTDTESLALLLITKLRNHPITFGPTLIKKHGIIIDITNNCFAF